MAADASAASSEIGRITVSGPDNSDNEGKAVTYNYGSWDVTAADGCTTDDVAASSNSFLYRVANGAEK